MYRVEKNPESKLLKGPHKYRPSTDPLELPKRTWQTYHEKTSDLTELLDRSIETIAQRGACVVAPPGCGKSWYARELVEKLKERGVPDEDIVRCAPTHAACREMAQPAQTLHRLAHSMFSRGKTPRVRYLIVDEVFCAGIVLQCLLNSLSFTDCICICIGDPYQFGPVCSTWKECETTPMSLLNSAFFHTL